jgi:hypothetical protein
MELLFNLSISQFISITWIIFYAIQYFVLVKLVWYNWIDLFMIKFGC